MQDPFDKMLNHPDGFHQLPEDWRQLLIMRFDAQARDLLHSMGQTALQLELQLKAAVAQQVGVAVPVVGGTKDNPNVAYLRAHANAMCSLVGLLREASQGQMLSRARITQLMARAAGHLQESLSEDAPEEMKRGIFLALEIVAKTFGVSLTPNAPEKPRSGKVQLREAMRKAPAADTPAPPDRNDGGTQ